MLGKILLGLGVPLVAKLASHIAKPKLAPYGVRGSGGELGGLGAEGPHVTCTPAGHGTRLCMTAGRTLSPQLKSGADVCKFMAKIAHADRESFYVLMADARNRIIGVEEVARGNLTGVEVHPRETFKGAVLANAAAIFVAHNHPSGSPEPSQDDIALTQRLAKAGELLGIPVRDHVIVAREGCTSLRSTTSSVAWGESAQEPSRATRRGRRQQRGR
jgi:proteasome lid subunit RPN8/RPN11